MCSQYPIATTINILLDRHRLKMRRIDAAGHAAKVVNMKTIGNFPNVKLVAGAVSIRMDAIK